MGMIKKIEHEQYLIVKAVEDDFSLNEVTKIAPDFRLFIEDAQYADTIVDLTSVRYIDTSGIGLLVNMNKLLMARDHVLVIVCRDETLLDFMKIIKLETLIKIFGTIDEAELYLDDLRF